MRSKVGNSSKQQIVHGMDAKAIHRATKSRDHVETEVTSPREQPAYTLSEAARYLKLPVATLRTWVVGSVHSRTSAREQTSPLIRPPTGALSLSFSNLIEAHVVRALRIDHGVSMKALRQAQHFAEKKLGIERLLLRKELCTDAGRVFLRRYEELIELSASGQLAMRRVFDEHLKRIEWDANKLPTRLYPFLASDGFTAIRPITIDPAIAFGRPVVTRRGIGTRVIGERIDAGETVEDLAADYDLEIAEIEEAVLYERAA